MTEDDLLEYEIFASWFACGCGEWVVWPHWVRVLIARYFAWKVRVQSSRWQSMRQRSEALAARRRTKEQKP